MSQWLRVITAHEEDPSAVLSAHTGWLTTVVSPAPVPVN